MLDTTPLVGVMLISLRSWVMPPSKLSFDSNVLLLLDSSCAVLLSLAGYDVSLKKTVSPSSFTGSRFSRVGATFS